MYRKYGKRMGSVWKGLEVYGKYGKNEMCMLSYGNYEVYSKYGKCVGL